MPCVSTEPQQLYQLVAIAVSKPGLTSMLVDATVTAQVDVKPPSCVVTVMVAVPAATAVTKPELFTVATAVLLELQVTVLFVALEGATVSVNWLVPPYGIEAVVGLTDTPVTATVEGTYSCPPMSGGLLRVVPK